MRDNPGAQYEISVDGVPRTHRDRQDIALQTARFLKSQNPNSMVKMKDLRTGEETVVAFKPEATDPHGSQDTRHGAEFPSLISLFLRTS